MNINRHKLVGCALSVIAYVVIFFALSWNVVTYLARGQVVRGVLVFLLSLVGAFAGSALVSSIFSKLWSR